MSRLIDADKLTKELSSVWKWVAERYHKGYNTTHGEMLDKVHNILINQPTAYNVDAVVEALEELKKQYSKLSCSINDTNMVREYIAKELAIGVAIEIVKRGGKND